MGKESPLPLDEGLDRRNRVGNTSGASRWVSPRRDAGLRESGIGVFTSWLFSVSFSILRRGWRAGFETQRYRDSVCFTSARSEATRKQ